jgi:hypothetical protein
MVFDYHVGNTGLVIYYNLLCSLIQIGATITDTATEYFLFMNQLCVWNLRPRT